jgi:hypothetical protein
VIAQDDHFGHRDPFTHEPTGEDGWTAWDYALANALQVIEDHTDKYGILVWERDDEAVEIDAVKKIHKFQASVDRLTSGTDKKPYKPAPGEYFVPEIWSRRKDADGNEVIQTYEEWLTAMIAKDSS